MITELSGFVNTFLRMMEFWRRFLEEESMSLAKAGKETPHLERASLSSKEISSPE
jgi:hypothetical protein